MKRIIDYRNLFGVKHDVELAELKTKYRNLMKDYHPDKILDDESRKAQAEVMSKKIIEGYHFLVSISPETHAQNIDEYTEITNSNIIEDFEYKGQTLKIIFHDKSSYEYFGVPRNVYIKLVNSSTRSRFARRHIYHEYPFRNVKKKINE